VVVGASTIAPPSPGRPAGLHFSPWQHWRPAFTEAVKQAGRFQAITIADLHAAGARW